MKILAIDTSVGISVALLSGTEVLTEVTKTEHGIQGEQTAAIISQLLDQTGLTTKDLTNVVVGVGPGPFTGLRVGIATAQAFGFAKQIPVTGICSLDAVAQDFGQDCVVVTDARRKELYWAKYQAGRIGEPQVDLPTDIAEQNPGAKFVGPAIGLYPDVISGKHLELRAAALGVLFASGDAKQVPLLPMYLRKPDAQEPILRKSVL